MRDPELGHFNRTLSVCKAKSTKEKGCKMATQCRARRVATVYMYGVMRESKRLEDQRRTI